jgi:WD40 repeat protein
MNRELISPFVLLAHPDTLSHRLTLENHSVSICRFNPDGALLAAATYNGLVLLVDTITSQIIRKLTAHVSSLNSIHFSSDV